MRFRSFGRDEKSVSEVGLGCWQLGGNDWGDLPETDALAVLRSAAETGVTFLDTADVYGLGRSEELIGKFLKDAGRDRFFVATKLGRFPTPGGAANFTPETIRAHTDASLKRLGIDCLDLTQLHCVPMAALKNAGVWDTLRALKREGKIRRFGASVESVAEAKECLTHADCASLQLIFNVFRQTPALSQRTPHPPGEDRPDPEGEEYTKSLFDRCVAQGVAVIVRLPLASGLLAGKYTPATTFAPQDHRTYNRNGEKFNVGETFAGLGFEKGLELTEQLRPLVPPGMPMAQMALRWCLDFPAVTTIIPGARNRDQAEGNAAASAAPPLSPELHAKLRDFFVNSVKPHVRGPD